MITRDIHQLQVVPAFLHAAKFIACGDANTGTCTCAMGITGAGSTFFPGMIIDRLGLVRNYKSLALAPLVYGDLNTSDENARVHSQSFSLGLQHSSACNGTFADYSTGDWLSQEFVWRQTTVSSTADMEVIQNYAFQLDAGAAGTLGGIVSTTTSTASGVGRNVTAGTTSTSISYYAGPPALFDLGGAKRFLRCLIKPIIDTTACASLGMRVAVTALFGEPDEAPTLGDQVRRILVTTPCAT